MAPRFATPSNNTFLHMYFVAFVTLFILPALISICVQMSRAGARVCVRIINGREILYSDTRNQYRLVPAHRYSSSSDSAADAGQQRNTSRKSISLSNSSRGQHIPLLVYSTKKNKKTTKKNYIYICFIH